MNNKYMLNELRQLALTAWLDSKQEEKEIKFYYESILNDLNRLEKLDNNIDNLKIENVDLKLRNKELEKAIAFLIKTYIPCGVEFKEVIEDGITYRSMKDKNDSEIYNFYEEDKQLYEALKEVFDDEKC